jgi:hypothetical protein
LSYEIEIKTTVCKTNFNIARDLLNLPSDRLTEMTQG